MVILVIHMEQILNQNEMVLRYFMVMYEDYNDVDNGHVMDTLESSSYCWQDEDLN